jgi:hypothetical protein
VSALEEIWGNRFKWFTVGKQRRSGNVRPLIDARTTSEAIDAVRRMDGIPIRILEVQLNGKYRGAADFQYEGSWGSSRKQIGKGNLLCDSAQIRVWSMVVQAPK